MPIRYAANLSLLFPELPFLDRFAAAAAAGFTHVEFQFPYSYPPDLLHAAIASNNLQVVLFNLYSGDWEAGERGLLCDPAHRDHFRRALDQALSYAQTLACPRLHAIAGNLAPHLSAALAHTTLVENLQYAAPVAAAAGITITIEALNPIDNPNFFLTTSRQALAILRDVAAPNVKFQFDFYHLQITEGNLTQNFRTCLPHIGHLQIADVPGRHQPGTGEINYPFVLQTIADSAYDGFVGLEYKPSGATVDALQWLPVSQRAAM
ncbi:MAG: hydroxypyruvate isomerase [Chloroflexi bacterium]|nr:hydroxypyruvate isomerase [Chloroflexota bacterium]